MSRLCRRGTYPVGRRKLSAVTIAFCIVGFLLLWYSFHTFRVERASVEVRPPIMPETSIQAVSSLGYVTPETRQNTGSSINQQSTQAFYLRVLVCDMTGRPAEGAKVTLRSSEKSEVDDIEALSLEKIADAKGIVLFSDIPWGEVWVLAARRDMYSANVRMRLNANSDFIDKEIVLVLHSTGVIKGKVVDDDGEPIPSARVVAFEKDLSAISDAQELPNAQITDEQGHFEFADLPEGIYRFRGFADGYAPGECEPVPTGSVQDAIISLAAGSSVSGIVRNATTRSPVAGFPIKMRKKESYDSKNATEADSVGVFLFTGLSEGKYELQSAHETMVLANGKVNLEVPRAKTVSGVELFVKDGVMVSGRVLSKAGNNPVVGVRVSAYHSMRISPLRTSLPTDDDGNYVLAGMLPGINNFTAQSDDGVTRAPERMLDVPEEGGGGFDIYVRSAQRVNGVVLDENEVPAAGATVHAFASNVENNKTGEGSGVARTNQDGTFSLNCFKCELGYDLILKATSIMGESKPTGPFPITDSPLDGIVLRLTNNALGSIAGQIRNTNGEPIFAVVRARSMNRLPEEFAADEYEAIKNSPDRWRTQGSTRTDMNGQFLIMSLQADEYELFAGEFNPEGFQSAGEKVGQLTLKAGEHKTSVKLVLDAGAGDITGMVTDEQGQPVLGVYIGASSDTNSREFECRTNESGRFRLANLTEGVYTVRAVIQGYTSEPIINVAPGQEINFILVQVKDEKSPSGE